MPSSPLESSRASQGRVHDRPVASHACFATRRRCTLVERRGEEPLYVDPEVFASHRSASQEDDDEAFSSQSQDVPFQSSSRSNCQDTAELSRHTVKVSMRSEVVKVLFSGKENSDE